MASKLPVHVPERLRQLASQALDRNVLAKELRALAAELEGDGTPVGGGRAVEESPETEPKVKRQKKGGKEFDLSAYHQRHVALQLMYSGSTFQGFARQDNTDNTIERHFFDALARVKLIPAQWDYRNLKYSRCGRTDAGVSALGQVVALLLRSKSKVEDPLPREDEELDYPQLINKNLPREIRVLGWTPVGEEFSARFSARYREYKYFIVNEGGRLDIPRMLRAGRFFLGEHDFRNFCKLDVMAVRTFRRTILDFRIDPVAALRYADRQVLAVTVRGTAFLWHQVRCMMAVLLLVGEGLEEPEVIPTLLDPQRTPRKPQYCMAPEEPLLLYDCGYEGLRFRKSSRLESNLEDHSSALLRESLVHTALASVMWSRNRKCKEQDHEGQVQQQQGTVEPMERSEGQSSGLEEPGWDSSPGMSIATRDGLQASGQGDQPTSLSRDDLDNLADVEGRGLALSTVPQPQLPGRQAVQSNVVPFTIGGGLSPSASPPPVPLKPRAKHIPLLKRATEPSVEERLKKCGAHEEQEGNGLGVMDTGE